MIFCKCFIIIVWLLYYSLNDISRYGGNGINIFGKNVISDMNLVIILIYRIGFFYIKIDIVFVK